MRKRPIVIATTIGLIASAIGIAIGLWIHWFPVSASKQAKPVDTLYDVLMIVSVPIFVLVVTMILFSVWQFRMRPGEEGRDGPPIHGNTRLEVIWTAVPAIILVSLCSYAYAVLRDIEKKHPNELVVNVVGEQFEWTYSYPQATGAPVESTVLMLPKGRPVHFKVSSRDVIHSFFIPEFRTKIDAVPGITTEVRATPTRLGTYVNECAELCGAGHATMRSTVRVVTPTAYTAWLTRQKSTAAEAGGGATAGAGGATAGGGSSSAGGSSSSSSSAGAGDASVGRATFTSAGCAGCHTLSEAGASGTVGPNLDQVLRGQSDDEIRQSIVDPNAQIAKGYQANVMPQTFGRTLSAQQLDGLVALLSEAAK